MTLGENPASRLQIGLVAVGQSDHFQCAGPVRKPANEAAFLKRRDQPVNAGFGRQIKRILHLVEGRRNAALLHTFVDEEKKFVLFARQHSCSTPAASMKAGMKQTRNLGIMFHMCSASGKETMKEHQGRKTSTSQIDPALAAGAKGGRMIRQRASENTFISDESCRAIGVATRASSVTWRSPRR